MLLFFRGSKRFFFFGLLFSLAWPPYNQIWTFPLGLMPLYLRMGKRLTLKEGLKCGWWWGWGFYIASLFWIGKSLLVDSERFAWLLPASFFILPAVLACYPAVSMALLARISQFFSRDSWSYSLSFCSLWSLQEWAQGHLFTGFPWNLTAYIWPLSLSQPVALIGSYGWGLVTLWIFILPWHSFFNQDHKRGSLFLIKFIMMRSILPTGMLLLLFFLWGNHRLKRNPPSFHEEFFFRLVQPAIPQKEKINPFYAKHHYHTLLSLSSQPSSHPLTHVIWPESAIPWTLSAETRFPFRDQGWTLLSGGRFYEDGHVFNSLLACYPSSSFKMIYAKTHLLPFGEYIPLRWFLSYFFPSSWIQKITPGQKDFSSGKASFITSLPPLLPFRTFICYESIFPNSIHRNLYNPQWILTITNDAWFGRSPGPFQHFKSTQFRAIEEGLPLIRVANTGISAVIDPLGRIVSSLSLEQQGVIDTFLPKAIRSPLYTKIQGKGWFFMIALSIMWISYRSFRTYKNKPFF